LIFIGTTTGNLSRSEILTGVEEDYVVTSTLNDATQHITFTYPLFGMDTNGNLSVNSGNGDSIISGSALTVSATWGAWTSSGPALPPGLPLSTINGSGHGPIVCNTSSGGTVYTLACDIGGIFTAFNHAYVLRIPEYAGQQWQWTGRLARACSGPSGTGIFYLVSGGRSSPESYPLTIYKLTCTDGGGWTYANYPTPNANMALSTIASIVSTDIDAGWTDVYCGGGICIDQTDGNPMLFCQGQSGATPLTRMIKVNKTTGAIIWNTSIIGNTVPGQMFAYSNITSQRYCMAIASRSGSPPNTILTIDTGTGTITDSYTTGLGGLTFFGPQAFSDPLGGIITSLDWAAGAGAPVGLNSSTEPFTGWAMLYVVAPPPAPSQPRRFLAECGPIRIIP
jgi:hypothetical protein